MTFRNHALFHPDQVIWMCPLGDSCKIRAPGEYELLWEIQASCIKAEGECRGGIPCPTFSESTFVAPL